MKKKYKIQETIVVEKTVEIEVTEDMGNDDLEKAIKNKAREFVVDDYSDNHGWICVDLLEVDIFDEKRNIVFQSGI